VAPRARSTSARCNASSRPMVSTFPGIEEKNRMALKRSKGAPGTFVVLEHTSKLLKGNPLRDPHVRKLGVWLPPQYHGSTSRFPVLFDLVGFTGSGPAHA